MLATIILSYAAAFALIVSRVAGFVLGSPFPGDNVTSTQRVGLVFGLTMVVTLFAPTEAAPREIGARLALAVAMELGCGLVIGLAFRFVLMAAEIAGQLLSTAVGLGSPSILNPTIEAQDSILSRIVTLLAMLVALGAGVHRVALAYLLGSFRALPVGTAMSLPSTALVFVDMGIRSFYLGAQLAMPVIGVGLVVQLGLAMIARAAPALQIFSVGLTVLLATGAMVVAASLRDVGAGLLAYFDSLSQGLEALLRALAGQAP